MKLVGDFQSAVQRELAWRKHEISDIRFDANKAENLSAYILRSGQVLLCAHWEGFLKKACQLYIDHIFLQDTPLKDLIPNITAIAYFNQVAKAGEAKYPGSEEHHLRLARTIISTINSNPRNSEWSPHTEGNPGSDVLERILKSIGMHPQLDMEPAHWATTKVFINEQLVRDRHKIAHGEGMPMSKPEILERSDRLLQLLDLLSEKLFEAAESRNYVASRPA